MTKDAKATAATAVKSAKSEPAIKLLTTDKAINDALLSIKRRGETLQQDIHVVACSVLQHIGKHSDIRIAERLLGHMPDMARKNAMRDWLTAFGPVMFDGDRPVFVAGGKVRLGDAMANPFWKFSPEKPYVAIDVAAAIASLVKKLQKDEKETKVSHGALIAGLEKLVTAKPAATAH